MRRADCTVYLEKLFAFGRSLGFNKFFYFLPVASVRALAFRPGKRAEEEEEEGPRAYIMHAAAAAAAAAKTMYKPKTKKKKFK